MDRAGKPAPVARSAAQDMDAPSGGPSGAWAGRRKDVAARIEAVALALFSAQGMENVTVENVADVAGISRRTFYRYFESTADILCAPMRRNMESWAQAFRARPSAEPVIISFYAATLHSLSLTDETRDVRLALDVIARYPEATRRTRRAMMDFMTALYHELIVERLAARGEDTAPAWALAAALAALMYQVAQDCQAAGVPLGIEHIDGALSALGSLLAVDREMARDVVAGLAA